MADWVDFEEIYNYWVRSIFFAFQREVFISCGVTLPFMHLESHQLVTKKLIDSEVQGMFSPAIWERTKVKIL